VFPAAARAAYYPYTYTNANVTRTVIASYPTRVAVYGGSEFRLDTLASVGVTPIVEQDNDYPDVVIGDKAIAVGAA
jgi:hypothetical protein